MAIPYSYNIRSVVARWKSAVVSVLGIAGTVGVFIAMLAMAKGFQATLVSSGSSSNSIIRRAGASSEMDSGVGLDQARVIADATEVARSAAGEPLTSPEMVVIAAFQLKKRPLSSTAMSSSKPENSGAVSSSAEPVLSVSVAV